MITQLLCIRLNIFWDSFYVLTLLIYIRTCSIVTVPSIIFLNKYVLNLCNLIKHVACQL